LDNAATSWPKPESVYAAVDQYQRHVGAAAGRGGYQEAESVARTLQKLRHNIARLIGAAGGANRIVFAFNCTDALNTVLHGVLAPGDHVVTSVAEHNSVLRPLADLAKRNGIETTMVPVTGDGVIDPDAIRAAVRRRTRLVAITHASNVTGVVQPIDDIVRIARDHGCLSLVDAAQTLGHVPIDVASWGVDFLAAPGHKGLLGPLGTGVLYVAPGSEKQLRAVRQGGTGTQSELARQPEELPDKFESGNLNVPGLVGLDAGVRFVLDHRLDQDAGQRELLQRLWHGLSEIPGVTLYGAPTAVGIASFTFSGYDPGELASLLDAAGRVQVRSGLHCAPEMHRALGTLEGGGAVRASCGHFNSAEDVDRLVHVMREL
jgi:cysteine desulfurase family protein